MIPWTTPTLPIDIDDIDLSAADEVQISIAQGRTKLHKDADSVVYHPASGDDPARTHIEVTFSQSETSVFKEGEADVQVNWLIGTSRDAVLVKRIRIDRQLFKAVMEQ